MADDFDPDALLAAPAPSSASMKIKPESPATDPGISPAMRGVLYGVIAPGESGGRNVIYGGKEITDLSKHPDVHVPITTGPNAGLYSTAAGPFQFIKSTYDMTAKETGKSDFSIPSQEENAAWLAKKTYKDATGRDLETDYASGDPKLREGIKRALASQWESLGKPGPRVDKLWSLGNDKFRFSDEAVAAHDNADDTSMVYMHPEHYLALSPSMDDDPSHSVTGGQALRSSLAKGEPVNNVPHLTMDENGQVVSQDGRSRALMANMAGVDAIPVALKNIAKLPDRLTGTSGNPVQTAGMVPKDQMSVEKSGGSIVGRMLGIGEAQAAEPTDDDWTPVSKPDDDWAPVNAAPRMSAADRLGTGMVDPVQGGAQLLHHITPEVISKPIDALNDWLGLGPNPTDENTRAREAAIQAQTPNPDRVETRLDSQGRATHVNTGPALGTDPVRMLGNVLSPMNLAAPSRALGAGGLAREMGNAAIQGATLGAMQPVTGEGNFSAQKLSQAAMGGVVGGVVPAGAAAAKTVWNWISGVKGAEALQDKATQTILNRIKNSEKGGGPSLQDMLDLVNTAPNKPWVLADMPSANLKSLVGKIARSPGEAKEIMKTTLTNRDLDAALRLKGDVMGTLGEGSVAYTEEALRHARSIMSKPLFDDAYRGGSIAPLRQQFETANADAGRAEFEAAREVSNAENKITEAARREQQAGDNVYGVNGAREDRRAAEAQRDFAQAKLAKAQAEKQQIADVMRQAQQDMEMGKPGAVWSPRIQEFLDNPRVKQGIQRGLRIERDEALADGRPMNPSEYAITGVDEAGNPIVGKVPTMRLLAVAKEGLDSMVFGDEFRTQLTGQLNKEGVAIDKMRRQFVNELDDLNPDYKKARNMWAGQTDSMEALRAGQDIFTMEPEAIEAMVHGSSADALRSALKGRVPDDVIEEAASRAGKGLTDSEKEFFKLGAAAKMRRMIEETGEKGDESRRLVASTTARRQLRALFDNDAEFNKFFQSLNSEHLMFDTFAKTYGGSQSAERLADDATKDMMGIAHGVLAAAETARGSMYAPFHWARAWEKLKPKDDPALTAAQARMLTSPAGDAIKKLQGAEAAAKVSPRRLIPFAVPPVVYGTEPKHAVGATTGMQTP